MRLPRPVKWSALFVALSAAILVAAVSIYFRVEQYKFRRQAELLLSDVRDLRLKRANAEEVKAIVKKWGFQEWGRGPGQPCIKDDCAYRLELVASPAQGHILAQPFVSAVVSRPLEWLGLRPAVAYAWVAIRRNALTSASFSIWTTGRGCDGRGRLECTLMGYADAKQLRGGWSSHQQPEVKLNQFLLHPSYLVGASSEWLNADTGGSPAVIVWLELSPDASTSDVSRLLQFDLSCLTRFLSCRDRDLMPAVWAQSVEDIRHSPKVLTCTPQLSKHVAELADAIAVVRTKGVQVSPSLNGRPQQLRDLEIVNVIKKPDKYAPPLTSVYVNGSETTVTAGTKSSLLAVQEYVFLLQVHNTPGTGWIAPYPCGVLALNDANLSMVREAAALTDQPD
jgi:hypothetical protein